MNTEESVNITATQNEDEHLKWFFMCDQKRRNALEPAYKMLEAKGFEVFTPMGKKIVGKGKSKKVDKVPLFTDILFVHSTEEKIDPIVAKVPTLHYRFKKCGRYREHIIVCDDDMERFIYAAEHTEIKEFFAIDALPQKLIGDKVLIHGGPLDGLTAILKKMQGSKKKHIFIELHKMAYGEFELTDFISLERVN